MPLVASTTAPTFCQKYPAKWPLGWLVPKQKVLLGLLMFLFVTLFMRITLFVANNPRRLDFHRLNEQPEIHQRDKQSFGAPVESRSKKAPPSRGDRQSSQPIPQVAQFQQHYRISSEHGIQMCVIEGNIPDLLTAIMCFVYNPTRFRAANRSIYSETEANRFCKSSNEAVHLGSTQIKSDSAAEKVLKQNWTYLAVVRDPLERFVSSFTRLCSKPADKSACNECGSNFNCFLDAQHKRALHYAQDPSTFQLTDLDKEFFPQSWHCEFAKHLKSYTLMKFGTKDGGITKLLNSLFFQLRERHVNNADLVYIYKQIARVPQSSEIPALEEAMLESKLLKDHRALKTLLSLYFYDYHLFHFELPFIDENS